MLFLMIQFTHAMIFPARIFPVVSALASRLPRRSKNPKEAALVVQKWRRELVRRLSLATGVQCIV
jgi:hypothetical protein